jgi:hypothetical protein
MCACWRFNWSLLVQVVVTIVCYLIGVCAPLSLFTHSLSLPARRTSSSTRRKCQHRRRHRWDDDDHVWCLHAAARSVDIQDALNANKEETQLPIFDLLAQICSSLVEKPNLLLEAPPGAVRTSSFIFVLMFIAPLICN